MQQQALRYLIVPGWKGSPAEHWQSHWQKRLPFSDRVEQADWDKPQLDAWVKAFEAALLRSSQPTIVVAHSLGCITLAHWARQASAALLARVRGALLVAPADVERPNANPYLQGFAPIPTQLLPFPSHVVASDNDPAATLLRSQQFAQQWGAELTVLEQAGHINVTSGHQYWEAGFAYLYRLQQQSAFWLKRRA